MQRLQTDSKRHCTPLNPLELRVTLSLHSAGIEEAAKVVTDPGAPDFCGVFIIRGPECGEFEVVIVQLQADF